MKLSFLGGAGTVTGSKFLLESSQGRILIDCGLFQGLKELRLRNWDAPPLDPRSLDAVVITHAHIDHSGYLPVLVRAGYGGPIYCTPPTRDLLAILLPDSGRIQEEDAAYANRKRISRHVPARPLYTEAEAAAALPQIEAVELGQRIAIASLGIRLQSAGHILGAASALVSAPEGRLLVSGDLGRGDDPLMPPPDDPPEADWVVVESTYGDRVHPPADPVEELAAVLSRTVKRGGILLVPSFAVGRTQNLLFYFHEVFRRRLAPRVPVYVNSPMATNATELYRRWHRFHRLDPAACEAICATARYVRSADESRRLNRAREPAVIISASGMATGGRVLHHLRTLLPDARNTVLLPGYQAPGTRGAALAAGTDAVKIHGGYVPVRAEVVQLGMFSAHADQHELVAWLARAPHAPRRVFVVHGDPGAADALRVRARDALGCPVSLPRHLDTSVLD